MVDRLVNTEANSKRIANVENCFGISGVPLALPGRVLVGEGVLTKICRKKPKPRQVFLFNDILVYGSIIINKKKYNRQHIIPLENVKLEKLNDEGDLKNGWLIKTPTKSFAVYAATATEKAEWMAHIEKCVDELIQRTGNRRAEEHAAVWVPDNASSTCMHCKKVQFTVLNRRHHCRNCGAVVCGSCSKNKFLIPSQSSKPVRVCNTCFDSLGKNRISIKRDSKSSDELVVNQKDKDQVLNVAAPPLVTALPAEISAQNEDQKPNEDDDSSESDSEERIDKTEECNKSLENIHLDSDDTSTFYSSIEPSGEGNKNDMKEENQKEEESKVQENKN